MPAISHDIPVTEMTPEMAISYRRAEGEIIRITPAVAEREPYCFHRNLADHLLLGEPITAPLAATAPPLRWPCCNPSFSNEYW